MKLEQHPHPTLCFCLSGHASIGLKGSWEDLTGGDLLVIPPHVPHSGDAPHWRPGSGVPPDSEFFWLECLPSCALVHFCATQNGSHESSKGCYVLDGGLYDEVFHVIAELRERGAYHEAMARSALFRIVVRMLRRIDEGAAFVAGGWEMERDAGRPLLNIAERVERFLRTHYSQPLGLSEICRQNFSSRSLVCREFKKRYGLGVMEYLVRLRLGIARRLLLSDLSIREVARLTGFSAPDHFSRRFRQSEGIPPRKWRQIRIGESQGEM